MQFLFHFTNHMSRWGYNDKPILCESLASIKTYGFRPNTNFGLLQCSMEDIQNKTPRFIEATNTLRKAFIHHGIRGNKPRVKGNFTIPVLLIVPANDIHTFQGYDHPDHAVTTCNISPEMLNINPWIFDLPEYLDMFHQGNHMSYTTLCKIATATEHDNWFSEKIHALLCTD